jgi:hypothetical protein
MLPREWSVQHRMVALRSVPTYIVSANGPIVSANGPGPLPELPDPRCEALRWAGRLFLPHLDR